MKKRHYILLAIVAVGLLVCAGVALRPRQLPPEECSQLYRDYADNPHVAVAFIKDFPVNDTLRVDVTTLQASTDSAWYALLRDFGASEEFIEWYQSNKANLVNDRQNSIFLFSMDKNNPQKRLSENDPDSRLVIGSYAKRTLCVFMTEKKIRETIIISETKKL